MLSFRRASLASALVGVGLCSLSSAVTSCSSDDAPPTSSTFTNDSGTPSSGALPPAPFTPVGDSSALPPPPVEVEAGTCASAEAQPLQGKRPVDIIFVIDNSESMAEEIAEVEEQINVNFTSIIGASSADYHIVMLSSHGGHNAEAGAPTTQRVCVREPLSDSNCSPIPPEPAENDHFFHHDITISSNNAFCQVLRSFHAPDEKARHPTGWEPFLRPSAFKIFAVITDDRVKVACNGFQFDDKAIDPISAQTAAGTFESALFGLSPLHFGSAVRPNFVWHSIIGLAPFDPQDLTKPHQPEAPLVTAQCTPSSEAPGLGYQALSRDTGGLRYPTCGLDFTTIFQAMAQDVLDKTTLACDYAMPENPDGAAIDPATTVVSYSSGTTAIDFRQVESAAACQPYSFYREDSRIKLCNDACAVVQNDPQAKVTLKFGCLPPIASTSGGPK